MENNHPIELSEEVIYLSEHCFLKEEHISYIQSHRIRFEETKYEQAPVYLGITPDYRASYYIGVDWLTEKHAVCVVPKLPEIDFIEMFISALKVKDAAVYFSKFYGIHFDKPAVKVKSQTDQLTPLLLLHFIQTLKKLMVRGLKRDYIQREENLKAKVRGRIVVTENVRKNLLTKRNERIYCSFKEYSEDIPENRLLKKALIFSQKILKGFPNLQSHKRYRQIKNETDRLLTCFEHVSADTDLYTLKHTKTNRLHREYDEALRLAKMLLKRFDYSISNVSECHEIPPYWIDMARLYEVYVYGLLNDAYPGQIQFQVDGACGTSVDFIKTDEKIIIDTKYKPQYKDLKFGVIEDIRQLSGYARDRKILKQLQLDERAIPNCLIIYLEPITSDADEVDAKDSKIIKTFQNEKLISEQADSIHGFVGFYKLSLALPVKK